jgi:predicted transcriptional regulator
MNCSLKDSIRMFDCVYEDDGYIRVHNRDRKTRTQILTEWIKTTPQPRKQRAADELHWSWSTVNNVWQDACVFANRPELVRTPHSRPSFDWSLLVDLIQQNPNISKAEAARQLNTTTVTVSKYWSMAS